MPRRRDPQRGATVLVMMGVLAVFALLIASLSRQAIVERRAARRAEAQLAAQWAAEAGVEAALADLAAGRAPRRAVELAAHDDAPSADRDGFGGTVAIEVTRAGAGWTVVATGLATTRSGAVASTRIIEVRAVKQGGRVLIERWNETTPPIPAR